MTKYKPPVSVEIKKAGKICDHCGYKFKKGDKATYYPMSQKVFCEGEHGNQPDPGTEMHMLWRIESHLSALTNIIKKAIANNDVVELPDDFEASDDDIGDETSDEVVPF